MDSPMNTTQAIADSGLRKPERFSVPGFFPFTDTAPLPPTPVKWTYRGIYRVGDAQVGVWSKPVSVTVGG